MSNASPNTGHARYILSIQVLWRHDLKLNYTYAWFTCISGRETERNQNKSWRRASAHGLYCNFKELTVRNLSAKNSANPDRNFIDIVLHVETGEHSYILIPGVKELPVGVNPSLPSEICSSVEWCGFLWLSSVYVDSYCTDRGWNESKHVTRLSVSRESCLIFTAFSGR